MKKLVNLFKKIVTLFKFNKMGYTEQQITTSITPYIKTMFESSEIGFLNSTYMDSELNKVNFRIDFRNNTYICISIENTNSDIELFFIKTNMIHYSELTSVLLRSNIIFDSVKGKIKENFNSLNI